MLVDDIEKSSMTCDVDAEIALIGSMFLDNDTIDLVASMVDGPDFYVACHRVLFQAILDVHERGVIADPVTVHELLMRNGQVNQPNNELNTAYIGEILDQTPTAANAEYYARIIKDRSVRRQLTQRGCEIVRKAGDLSTDVADIVDEAHAKILDISATASPRCVLSLNETLSQALAAIDRKSERGGGIKTGFIELDELTGGLHRQELTIIAARPSVGKTAFALNIATRVSFNRELTVLFVSLEQSVEAIGNRLLASEAEIDMHKIRNGRLTSDDIRKLMDAKDSVSRHRLYISDTPGQTVTQIGAEARRVKSRHGLDLLIVDYLQLVEAEHSGRSWNRDQHRYRAV